MDSLPQAATSLLDMKTRNIVAPAVLLFCIMGSFPALAMSNFVVIGAFRNETNAVHFTEAARHNHFDASYKLNKVRQLFYVYIMQSDDVHKAVHEVLKLRSHSEYTGAWVYHGVLGDEQVQDGVEIKAPAKIEDVASIQVPPTEEEKATKSASGDSTTQAPPPVVEIKIPEAGVATDPAATTKLFFFKIFTINGQPHEGNVDLIDVDRQKRAGSFKGNEPVAVKAVNASGEMRFDCQVTGYRQTSKTLNFRKPDGSRGDIIIENNQIIVPFELVRLKKGDQAILYNVYFYKDAAIMRPESKYELDGLLAMMTENQRYRIRFHGHTNGKSAGKIIEMGESRNYFSLTGTKEGFGSANQLSEERARVIMEYMISEGIAADRLEIKAWGGKKPIHKTDSPLASLNVRVEVEILED
jgi:outer membrane protein OmpA-like peptidoglycan-associated protein